MTTYYVQQKFATHHVNVKKDMFMIGDLKKTFFFQIICDLNQVFQSFTDSNRTCVPLAECPDICPQNSHWEGTG